MLIWIEIERFSTVRSMSAPSSFIGPAGCRGWAGSLVAVAACAALCAGCVQRRMTIRSNPPGALVYVDDYQLGTTPVSHDFVYYGTRKIRLVKDGYETLTVRQPFPLPWYQYFPLDFVTENILPWEVRDERVIDLAMQPAAATPPESVVARAEQARLAAGSLPTAPAPQVVTPLPQPSAAQPIPAPAPAMSPFQQFAPQPSAPPQGLVLPPPSPAPFQGLQPPASNAPSQGIPSLGVP
jgi:hypothetical protein